MLSARPGCRRTRPDQRSRRTEYSIGAASVLAPASNSDADRRDRGPLPRRRRAAGRRATPRCGSCARPVASCPSTGRSAARARSSTRSSSPTLAAEITLQPVRRYGVDAAVLYSDIVVPPHAVGFGIDVAPGTGPVAEHPFRGARRSRSAAPARTRRHRLRRRHRRPAGRRAAREVPLLAFAGAPFTVGSYLIEGRRPADYRHTKAMMHTDEPLWHERDGPPRRPGDHVHRRPAAARGRRLPAVRLVGRFAVGRRLRPVRAPTLAARVRRTRRPPSRRRRDPLRDRVRPPARSMYAAGPTVIGLDWRTPIADARRTARRRHGACRATSIRRSCSPGAPRRWPAARARPRRQRRPSRAHLQPRPRRATRHRPRRAAGGRRPGPRADETMTPPYHPAPAERSDRRRADGVRHATRARRDPAVLHRHPARPAADRRAARRPDPALRGDRRHLAARRADRGASATPCSARSTRSSPGPYQVVLGLKHADPKVESAVDEVAATGIRRIVGVVLAPHYSAYSIGQYLGRAGEAAEPHGVDRRRHRVVGDRTRLRRLPGARPRRPPGDDARPDAGAVHGPLAAGADHDAGDPYPDELRATAEAVAAAARAHRGRRLADRLAERRTHTRAVDRTRHPRRDRRARRRPRGRRRRRVGGRVRRRSPRGALRPRHRGPPTRTAAAASASIAPPASTTTRR